MKRKELEILDEVLDTVLRARGLMAANGIDWKEFDAKNSRNDWIAYVNAYLGRASDKVFRNEREGEDYRDNMLKAAGLIVSALVAYDAQPKPATKAKVRNAA